MWMAALAIRPAPAASSNSKAPFYLGADISSLAQVEARTVYIWTTANRGTPSPSL
jgi:hypothetical protein